MLRLNSLSEFVLSEDCNSSLEYRKIHFLSCFWGNVHTLIEDLFILAINFRCKLFYTVVWGSYLPNIPSKVECKFNLNYKFADMMNKRTLISYG